MAATLPSSTVTAHPTLVNPNSDGISIGLAATDTIGFYGATAVAQPSGAGQAVPTDLASCIVWITKVRLDLIALGLIKGA